MDMRFTNNEAELLRAIVANRLEQLTDDAQDPRRHKGDRRQSAKHALTVMELLIAIDDQEEI